MGERRRPLPSELPLAAPPGVRVTRYASPGAPQAPVETWALPGGASYSPAHPQPNAALLPRPVPAVGEHQAARPALVVGIAALVGSVVVGLGLLFSPFAWAMGRTAVREIDASGGALTGRRAANAGRILGIVGTAFMGIALLAVIGLAVIGVLATTEPS